MLCSMEQIQLSNIEKNDKFWHDMPKSRKRRASREEAESCVNFVLIHICDIRNLLIKFKKTLEGKL